MNNICSHDVKQPKTFVQLRCIRMNGKDGVLVHPMPQYGYLKINRSRDLLTTLNLPPPPNDTKKRKDKMHDLTKSL